MSVLSAAMVTHPRAEAKAAAVVLSDAAGSGIAPPRTLTLVEVNSYCPAPHCPWQLSVPPDTPPSSPFIVAPLLTWQICPGGPAWQPDIEPSPSVSAFAG